VVRAGKQRLDVLLAERNLAESRERARALVMAGAVKVNGRVETRPGALVPPEAALAVEQALPYVSRGGLKLAHALDRFDIVVAGRIAADVGASTGGFTDVLLQRGAVRVYAIDVGYGQLHWKLRQDPRVVVMERTNVRYLASLPEAIDICTIDVSFISLKLVLPVVRRWLGPRGEVVALVKPQFEAGREQVGRGGVVRDRQVHREVLLGVSGFAHEVGFTVAGMTASPVLGPAGNREFLLHLRTEGQASQAIAAMADAALESSSLGQG
jgi:23S rRNA (cytidine1920-2'-O)/16S rRNA (cytidine1409-2'-O)-methyltransferase